MEEEGGGVVVRRGGWVGVEEGECDGGGERSEEKEGG